MLPLQKATFKPYNPRVGAQKKRNRDIPPEEWRKYYQVIAELNSQHKKIHQIRDEMISRYRFTASVDQYKRKFAEWGLTRHIPCEDMKYITHEMAQREAAGKSTAIKNLGSEQDIDMEKIERSKAYFREKCQLPETPALQPGKSSRYQAYTPATDSVDVKMTDAPEGQYPPFVQSPEPHTPAADAKDKKLAIITCRHASCVASLLVPIIISRENLEDFLSRHEEELEIYRRSVQEGVIFFPDPEEVTEEVKPTIERFMAETDRCEKIGSEGIKYEFPPGEIDERFPSVSGTHNYNYATKRRMYGQIPSGRIIALEILSAMVEGGPRLRAQQSDPERSKFKAHHYTVPFHVHPGKLERAITVLRSNKPWDSIRGQLLDEELVISEETSAEKVTPHFWMEIDLLLVFDGITSWMDYYLDEKDGVAKLLLLTPIGEFYDEFDSIYKGDSTSYTADVLFNFIARRLRVQFTGLPKPMCTIVTAVPDNISEYIYQKQYTI
ncbi:hypothetical protein H072_5971 [Dactylellina haptotyla CBS 200.50]|uniref:Clr5 domain-containing protein n=1 Tax=Dactylellina haptotyla (strain CBS 200.50) TaxID=1284197 RepID=S8BLC6_DACHA|nr:hypothetical protein H072_5971 [Dactylellina haptotyla CBS 200.50]